MSGECFFSGMIIHDGPRLTSNLITIHITVQNSFNFIFAARSPILHRLNNSLPSQAGHAKS
jgi:hypothetical protein